MVLRFGPFTLDSAQRRLWREGADVPLTPKAFDLLVLLAAAAPRALAKDALLRQVWPDVFTTENNLATLVRDLRARLDDDASAPRYIRTVFAFGYAFIGPVTVDAVEVVPANGATWRLVGEAGEWPLAEGEHVIGRAGAGVTVIDDPTISRHHARLSVSGATVLCSDLGSKNGTWVGTTAVTTPTPVADGDRIRFGAVLVTLQRLVPAPSTVSMESVAPQRTPSTR